MGWIEKFANDFHYSLGPMILADKLRAAHSAHCEHKAAAERVDARWRQAVENVRGYYPEDVFPPDGESQECKAAATIRAACDSVLKEAGRLKKEEDDGAE